MQNISDQFVTSLTAGVQRSLDNEKIVLDNTLRSLGTEKEEKLSKALADYSNALSNRAFFSKMVDLLLGFFGTRSAESLALAEKYARSLTDINESYITVQESYDALRKEIGHSPLVETLHKDFVNRRTDYDNRVSHAANQFNSRSQQAKESHVNNIFNKEEVILKVRNLARDFDKDISDAKELDVYGSAEGREVAATMAELDLILEVKRLLPEGVQDNIRVRSFESSLDSKPRMVVFANDEIIFLKPISQDTSSLINNHSATDIMGIRGDLSNTLHEMMTSNA